MNQEIKTKWLEALRSGTYQQGREGLRHIGSNQFCCLGVLCDLVDPTGWRIQADDADYYSFTFQGEQRMGIMPHPLRVVTGLAWPDCPYGVTSQLIEMNDNARKSFNEIADYIEEKL